MAYSWSETCGAKHLMDAHDCPSMKVSLYLGKHEDGIPILLHVLREWVSLLESVIFSCSTQVFGSDRCTDGKRGDKYMMKDRYKDAGFPSEQDTYFNELRSVVTRRKTHNLELDLGSCNFGNETLHTLGAKRRK